MPDDEQTKRVFSAEDIVVRHGDLSAVRKHREMYLGGSDLKALIAYVVEDVVQAKGGRYSRIEVSVDRRRHVVRVVDDDDSWQPALFSSVPPWIPRAATDVAGGLVGVRRGENLFVLNALSEWLEMHIELPSGGFRQRFARDKGGPHELLPGRDPAWAELVLQPRTDVFGRTRFPTTADLGPHLAQRLGAAARVGVGRGFVLVTRPLPSASADAE